MATQDVSANNFGLLIAYVIPGFTAMNGLPGMTLNHSGWGASATDNNCWISVGLDRGNLCGINGQYGSLAHHRLASPSNGSSTF